MFWDVNVLVGTILDNINYQVKMHLHLASPCEGQVPHQLFMALGHVNLNV
jgi:hypothetical protein